MSCEKVPRDDKWRSGTLKNLNDTILLSRSYIFIGRSFFEVSEKVLTTGGSVYSWNMLKTPCFKICDFDAT